MALETLTEQEYLELPLAEKQFYQSVTQWYGMSMWHTLKNEESESFKEQFPSHIYRKLYFIKDLN